MTEITNTPLNITAKRNKGLGLLKALACFLVVWIHFGPRGADNPLISSITNYTDAFCRFAVPVFFAITGYYIAGSVTKTKKYIIKVSIITFIALVIYGVLHALIHPNIWISLRLGNIIKWIGYLILFNKTSPIGIHLWYLPAALYSIIIIITFFLQYGCGTKILYTAAVVLWCIANILNYTPYSDYCRSFLFIGIPSMTAGVYFRNNENIFQRTHIITLLIVLQSLVFIEVALRSHFGLHETGRDIFFAVIPLALTYIALFKNLRFSAAVFNPFIYIGDKLSANIYLFHIAIFYLLTLFIEFNSVMLILLRPFIVFGTSVLIISSLLYIKSLYNSRLAIA